MRRNLSIAQVAERATCSPVTINRVEKGSPTVAIGIYLRVLYALQLDDDILLLAQKDDMGRALQDLALKHRERASKKEIVFNVRWSFKHKPYKPLSFSSAELAICVLPSLNESVTLDSLDKPQMAEALTPLKKMTGNKPK